MDVLIGAVISVLIAVFIFLLKGLSSRIHDLEKNTLHRKEIRDLVEDKIGGIRADVADIKLKIDRLFELYMEDRSNPRG